MSLLDRFQDLAPRMVSGLVLAVAGAVAVWAGGVVFLVFAVLAAGLMLWELARMLAPGERRLALLLGALGGAALAAASLIGGWGVAALAVPAVASLALPERGRAIFALYGTALLVAAFGILGFRMLNGPLWILWLMLVVIASDVAGYFVGRAVGGPKFWPRLSPKKTWSGTVAGWLGAGAVSAVFALYTPADRHLIWMGMMTAMAGQMGDIAESAVKRFAGVKDSSRLIPGHGGLLDRFDAILGAALFMMILVRVVVMPRIGG